MGRLRKIKRVSAFEHDSEGSWAISYGDMITLLLSFFVIFFSFDFKKDTEQKLESNIMNNIALMDTLEGVKKEVSEKHSEELTDLNDISTIVTKKKNGEFVVFFKGANFFDSGATKINEMGEVLLEKFISKYLPFAGKYRLKIQAFTDNKPVTKSYHRYQDNVELSALRSISVLRHMQKNGVPLRRVEIGGKGIMSPKALDVLGLDTTNIEQMRKMSRTIALILYREDAS